jgi:DNA-binding MarR family transcriptional regulator
MNHINSEIDTYTSGIVQNVLGVLPMIHKKLVQAVDIEAGTGLTRYHYAILGILSKSGPLPVSVVGNRLFISKPQMTAIIDRLVELKLVIREPDREDRRIINISVTDQGKTVLGDAVEKIKKDLVVKIAALSEQDRKLLSESLKNLARIGTVL